LEKFPTAADREDLVTSNEPDSIAGAAVAANLVYVTYVTDEELLLG